jgi:hypothetical protein
MVKVVAFAPHGAPFLAVRVPDLQRTDFGCLAPDTGGFGFLPLLFEFRARVKTTVNQGRQLPCPCAGGFDSPVRRAANGQPEGAPVQLCLEDVSAVSGRGHAQRQSGYFAVA